MKLVVSIIEPEECVKEIMNLCPGHSKNRVPNDKFIIKAGENKMEKDPIMEKLTDMTNRKFCVFDKECNKMHEAEEICRIHINEKGVVYAVLLWSGELLMEMSNRKGFILYSYKEGKKKKVKKHV